MKIIGTILIMLSYLAGGSQTFTETITKEFKFEKSSNQNTFILANIIGNIKVEGCSGDKILIEAIRTIKAKNSERLEKGKKEMQLKQIDRFDTIIFYVAGSCTNFNYQKKKKGERHWAYNWDCDNGDCNQSFDYKFDFIVRIPKAVNIEVSTVNEGNITVAMMKAGVTAHNVNGTIKLSGLEGVTQAITINGNVDLDFTQNPNGDCRFYTLNGDINANFMKGLAANLSFKSFNGELYTNLQSLTSLPMEIEKVEGENGIHLKVSGSKYKIRQGGALLDFETFNGDTIVKEK